MKTDEAYFIRFYVSLYHLLTKAEMYYEKM